MKKELCFLALLGWCVASAQEPSCISTQRRLQLEEQACPPVGPSVETLGPVTVDSCCPAVTPGQDDDQRRQLEGTNSNNFMRALQGPETCRSVEISQPYCVPESSGCNPNKTKINLDFVFDFFEVNSADLCCQECFCWGDPRCTSFDRTRQEWIVCDDRRPSDCLHKPGLCNSITDHLGETCEFVRRTRKKKNGAVEPFIYKGFKKSGSPCQSTSIYEGTGPFPTMVMFERDGIEIVLTLGDRGVTKSVDFTTGSLGTFTIESDLCIETGDEANAAELVWSNDMNNAVPSTWTVSKVGSEIVWEVHSEDFSVFANLTCAKTNDFRTRIDVSVRQPVGAVDDQSIFQDPNNPGGFCFSGRIAEATPSTLTKRESEECLLKEIGGCLEACKAVVNPQCNDDNLEAYIRQWCRETDLSGVSPPLNEDECFELITMEEDCDKTSKNWANLVCQLDFPDDDQQDAESGFAKCIMTIEDFTWNDYVDMREPFAIQTPQEGECVDDPTKYPKSKPDECAVGAEVQYFVDGEGWVTAFFIPVDMPPCDNLLEIHGAVFPELVLNPIRIAQCESIEARCLNVNKCLPTNGFTVNFEFETFECAEPSCYNCELFEEGVKPKVCDFGDDFKPLGNCSQCCEPDIGENPPVAEQGRCRNQRTLHPYCDESEEPDRCDLLKESGMLEFKINYLPPDTKPENCCLECSAYGDPELTSFKSDGLQELDAYIICDGRRKGRRQRCPITENTCEEELDHEGRTCFFNQTKADLIGNTYSNIGAIGSPCEINFLSSKAVMNLYTVTTGDQYELNVTLGERAVIDDVKIVTSSGTFVLDAERCFGDPMLAWDGDVFSAFEMIEFDTEDQLANPRGAERGWKLTDPETGIFVGLTCIKMIALDGPPESEGIVGYRINVNSIIESDDMRGLNGTGYCPTGIIDFQKGTVTDTSDGSVFDECTWQRWPQALTLCKALLNPGCTIRQVPKKVKKWCKTANVMNDEANPADACKDTILAGANLEEIGANWAVQYCMAISNNRPDTHSLDQWMIQCLGEINENTFGIDAQIQMFGRGERNSANTCQENPMYGLQDDVCERGIFVEYEQSEGVWVEAFFVPYTQLPCDGIVKVSASDFEELFTNPIRFRQCQQVAGNGCALDATCLPAQGYSIEYKFSQAEEVCE